MAGYKGGRIVRIKVKGFMTYEDLELIPKPGLNLIIGLNGSGKSSIMSAICLGLAGKPQYTGKSAQLSDFIKLGHSRAKIEIELEGVNRKNVVIGRTIMADKNLWFVNHSPANPSEVIAIVKKYNIDIGNLCQFLPQEKVVEFSKMDKRLRLENMLQAIGEPRLFTLFTELKQMRGESTALEKEMEKLRDNQNSEYQRNERLKSEVEKHVERKKLQSDLTTLELRKMIIEYDVSRDNLTEIKKQRKKLKDEKLKMEKETNILRGKKDSVSTNFNNLSIQVKEKTKQIAALSEKLSRILNRLADLHDKVDLAKVEFRNRIEEKKNQKVKLSELEMQIRGLQELQEQNKDIKKVLEIQGEQNLREHEKIRTQLSELDPKLEQLNLEVNRYEYMARGYMEAIVNVENEENKKMEILKQRFRHTYDAVCWLQQNQFAFKSTICLPALLSIKVHDDNHRKFIENHVAVRDLLAFVCEDPMDVKRLTAVLKVQKNLSVNIALIPEVGVSNFNSPSITPQMRQLGLECFLKDLFTAPDPVMCYLCSLYQIHNIPICNNNADRNMDIIIQSFPRFFTATEKISGKRSKYGNRNLSVKRDHITGRNILPNTKDSSDQLHRLKAQLKGAQEAATNLKDQYEECQAGRSALEMNQEKLRAAKIELTEKLKKISSIRMQLLQKIDLYKKKEAEVIDERVEKAKATEKICSLNAEKMDILSDIHSILKEIYVLKLHKGKNILVMKVLSRTLTDLKSEVKEKETELQTAERRFEEKSAEFNKLKEEGLQLYSKINNQDKSLISGLIGQTSDLEEVEQKIVNIQAQLELNCEDNSAVIEEYKRREKTIVDVQKEIENCESKIQQLKSDIQRKKNQWLPSLEYHISNINRKFTEYYKFLECAGEISLDKSEDTDDFLKYGLQIRLKYRADEDFIELSQTHHSGGECSVAAIIFILSLQELTEVPFRCIDEINQGMDAVNERKIYQLIADASKGGSCSQYFLLTPKLLMDLSYHKDVAVHIIFNSHFLKTGLNLKKHLDIVSTN